MVSWVVDNQQQNFDPNELLWRGIVGQRDYEISEALKKGASAVNGPLPGTLKSYPERKLVEGMLPLCALFRQSERLIRGLDSHFMQYKNACKTLVMATPKKHYGLRLGTTPLLEYTQVPKQAQRHAIFMQVLRRTPKDALNARDERGFSALDHALQSGLMQSVKALLLAGADPDARNERGENALWMVGKLAQDGIPTQDLLGYINLLNRTGAKVRSNQDGVNYLHMVTSTPLSALNLDIDFNTLDTRGRSLAMVALQNRAWGRLNDLMQIPEVDWSKQFPDLEAVHAMSKTLSSLDMTGRQTLDQVESLWQKHRLECTVQATSPTARVARARF